MDGEGRDSIGIPTECIEMSRNVWHTSFSEGEAI